MLHSEQILEKILRQSKFTGIIALAETRSISLKELIDEMKSYQCWSEENWERYYQESRFNLSQSLEILKQKQIIFDLKKENEKLNKLINESI